MKINLTTCNLMSGDKFTDRSLITSFYINRDAYINVEEVKYRSFLLE